ncbi:MAG TPA: hypothetical protein VF298_03785 [Bacteroidales bacterium]
MKKIAALLTILVFIIGSVHCQKLLILERPGTIKHFFFKTGDRIRLYDSKSMSMIHGDISRITDTVIVINMLEPVILSRVSIVYRPLTMLHIFSRTTTAAGLGYFLLTGFNNAINKKSPIIDHGTLIVSALITGAGVATSFIRYRKFALGTHWRLKVIDIDNPGK